MLIRLVVKNVLSFGEEREFNMFPYANLANRLPNHIYSIKDDFSLLKMAAVYGANGSGKSNFVQVLGFLKQIVVDGSVPKELENAPFLLQDAPFKQPQILGIEFLAEDGQTYWYAIELLNRQIVNEELYATNFGKGTPVTQKLVLLKEAKQILLEKFMKRYNAVDYKFIQKESDQIISEIYHFLSNRFPAPIRNWFSKLDIITPAKKSDNLIYLLANDATFNDFANEMMQTFQTGIKKLVIETQSLEAYYGTNEYQTANEIRQIVEQGEESFIIIKNEQDLAIATKDGEEVVVKLLLFEHGAKGGDTKNFHYFQLSDGTKRLLDYLVVLSTLILRPQVVVIDEVARSIHPALLKAMMEKFSKTTQTQGQLIFTTHEANLLDQAILRPDEVWFIEKDKEGCSDMYPLSEFKEHKTKDIRKGYLNGRYGAIPFLGDFQHLNWENYAAHQPSEV